MATPRMNYTSKRSKNEVEKKGEDHYNQQCGSRKIHVSGGNMYNVWIAILAVLIMLCGLVGIFYLVIKQQAAITNKLIQFIAVTFVLPLLVALGITNVLGRETIGTLLGVVVGYVLSNFARD